MHIYSNFRLKILGRTRAEYSEDEQISTDNRTGQHLLITLITKSPEQELVVSEAVEVPSQQCSYLAETRLHTERTRPPQLPAALLRRLVSGAKF